MYTHINNDINFDESVELNNDKKNEIINEFIGNNIDKEVLDELKNSIHADSTNSDTENSEASQIINNKIGTISISSNDTSKSKSTEKKGLKHMIKKNVVSKAKKLFNLFGAGNSKESPKNYSDKEIKTAFSEINECCDLLINSESQKNLNILKIEMPKINENSNSENSNSENSNSENSNSENSNSYNNNNIIVDTNSNRAINENIPLTIENVSLISNIEPINIEPINIEPINIEPINIEIKIAELNERVQNELKEKFKEIATIEAENIETSENDTLNELKELTDLKIVSNSHKKKHKKKKH
jgi:hypothetical protein